MVNMDGKIVEYLMTTFEEATIEEQVANINLMTADDCIEFANMVVVIENTSDKVMDRIFEIVSKSNEGGK